MNFISTFEELNKLYESVELETEIAEEPITEAAEEEVVEIVEETEEAAEEAAEEPVESEPKQVVLECSNCGALVIKDEAEAEVDEETDLANIEEKCKFCDEANGFNIIGTFAPYDAESAELEEGIFDIFKKKGPQKNNKSANNIGTTTGLSKPDDMGNAWLVAAIDIYKNTVEFVDTSTVKPRKDQAKNWALTLAENDRKNGKKQYIYCPFEVLQLSSMLNMPYQDILSHGGRLQPSKPVKLSEKDMEILKPEIDSIYQIYNKASGAKKSTNSDAGKIQKSWEAPKFSGRKNRKVEEGIFDIFKSKKEKEIEAQMAADMEEKNQAEKRAADEAYLKKNYYVVLKGDGRSPHFEYASDLLTRDPAEAARARRKLEITASSDGSVYWDCNVNLAEVKTGKLPDGWKDIVASNLDNSQSK
jgi:hypothetical protein